MPANNREGIVAKALRQAGFIPLPRLWVKKGVMPEILRITERFKDEVNDIRGRTNGTSPKKETDR